MLSPLISIIVPVYQAAFALERCLDSILRQTLTDWECICIDDGSTDSGVDILKAYAAKDPRIRVLRQSNAGVSAARNAGLDAARGQYVAFVDSDDFICPRMMATLWELAESEQASCAIGACRRIDASKATCAEQAAGMICPGNTEQLNKAPERDEAFIRVVWNKLIRRSLLEENGIRFPVGVSYGEDTAFNYCLLPYCQKLAATQEPLYNYVSNVGSLSQTAPERVLQLLDACAFARDFYQTRGIGASCRGPWLDLLVHTLRRIRSLAPHRKQKNATLRLRAFLEEFQPTPQELSALRSKDARKLQLILAGRSDLSFSYYWLKATRALKRKTQGIKSPRLSNTSPPSHTSPNILPPTDDHA